MRILHAALPAEWAAARETGSYQMSTRGRSLAEEGFIHASTTVQLAGVLSGFYADVDEVVLLVADVAGLLAAGSPVRWEHVADLADPFPHVYGPIPVDTVVATIPLRRGDGWQLPDLAGLDVA